MTESASTSQTRPKPGPRKSAGKPPSNPEAFVEKAKKAVLDNYNSSRDEVHAPALGPDDLFITWYGRILQNWQVIITSPIARRLMWEVSYNNYRNEIYINVYQKINVLKVSQPDKVTS